MKSFTSALVALACCVPSVAWSQGAASVPATVAPAASAPGAQVGLIDVAHIFKNSHKFLAKTEELQLELQAKDAEAKNIVERARKYQDQLANGGLKPGSPEADQVQEQLVRLGAELETFKQVTQQSIVRKEAEIYKTVYMDVESAVQKYAQHYKYTLILRFERGEVATAVAPQEILNGMNRQVVMHRQQDDITDPVLKFLNAEWARSGGQVPAGAPTPGGAVTPASGVKARTGGAVETR